MQLAKRGYELFVTDLAGPALDETVSELKSKGTRVDSFAADLTSSAELLALTSWVQKKGSLDLLVNNAGYVKGGPFTKLSWADHERTFAVNLLAPMRLLHELLPMITSSREGGIITIASASGFIGFPYAASYGSSKWAAIGLHEGLRHEIHEDGHRHVRLLCACPSYIDTGLFAGAKAPLLMPFLKAKPLAEKILDAWERGDRFLLEPFLVKFVPLIHGVLPRFLQDFVFKILGVQHGMKSWRGRE